MLVCRSVDSEHPLEIIEGFVLRVDFSQRAVPGTSDTCQDQVRGGGREQTREAGRF